MSQILVLGAGRSTPYLIRRLLDRAAAHDWQVIVADVDPGLAAERVAGHPRGTAADGRGFRPGGQHARPALPGPGGLGLEAGGDGPKHSVTSLECTDNGTLD